jgi:hypothetical protein
MGHWKIIGLSMINTVHNSAKVGLFYFYNRCYNGCANDVQRVLINKYSELSTVADQPNASCYFVMRG